MNPNDIQIIEWLDSRGCAMGWVPLEDLDAEPVLMTSVGFVHAETNLSVTLVPHFGPGTAMGAVTIPISAINRRGTLKGNLI